MGTVYKVLAESTITDAPAHFPARLIIENCENIHIHFRNMRLEFSKGEFIQFANVMAEAKANLDPSPLEWIPLDAIEPWDEVHSHTTENEYGFIAESQDLHIARVEDVKKAIEAGKIIRPILVAPIGDGKYKRKDGFCRYMAHKLMNLEKIECIVLEDAPAGGQDQMAYVVSSEEHQAIKNGVIF